LKAAVSKTVMGGFVHRGFESLPLRTASHAERRAILAAGAVHVRISRGHPRGTPSLPVVRELMPARELFAELHELDWTAWQARYVAGLDGQPEAIEQRLAELAAEHPGQTLVLCCFERVERGEHCHRRAFAEWWEARTGTAVPELHDVA
jgi:uncharacterized protein YeaO (DUF488 family)